MQMTDRSSPPEVSVIIPAYNASASVSKQLDALSKQALAPTFEVVLADNGSTDGTPTVASAYTDALNIKVVDASATRGASHARNVGARAAAASRLAFVDADDIVDPRWLSNLFHALLQHPGALLFGKLDYSKLNSSEVLRAYGYASNGLDGPGASVQRTPAHVVDPVVESLPGGNFALDSKLWFQLGGMREDFPYGAEDADLGIRAIQAGLRSFRVPDAIVYCRLRETGSSMFRQQRAWSRSRAILGTQHEDHRVGVPGLKGALVKLGRTLTQDGPDALKRRDSRRLMCNLGISVGRLEGAVLARKVVRARQIK